VRQGPRLRSRYDHDTFAADERTRAAVIRNIEIIGEAAGKLPYEVTARAPQIPWRLICDMRNVLAHAYFGVSLKIVWDTATTQIDDLERPSEHCSSDVHIHDQQARTHDRWRAVPRPRRLHG
jgi:uncharacterized protein with HEPN domain